MNEKRKALGRGLESLIPAARATATVAAPEAASGDVVRELPVEQIEPNPYQTRTHWDETALNELAASIKVSGVVQPITVRSLNGRYQLVTGERRWRASQIAGKATIPSIVRQISNEQAMEMTIVENLQREDLNPMEQARAFERLSREFNLTQEQMAQRTGKDRSSVANFLRLLKLPADVQNLVDQNKISFGHAKALMPLDSPEAMARLAQRVVALSMSVRQTEGAVANLLNPPEKQEKVRVTDPNVREVEKQMERALGVRVTINDRRGRGRIVIEYKSLEDFDRVVELLGKS